MGWEGGGGMRPRLERWKAILGFVGDSTLRLAVADVSPDGEAATQVYCPASVPRKSVQKINISS
jgi:hypothetical protein